MDKYTIIGGKRLTGEVRISGSKNAALPCLFATLLTDDPCVLENVPDLQDISTSCGLLTYIGKKVVRTGNRVEIKSTRFLYAQAPYEMVRRMRASSLVLGPLLARLGHVKVSLPGGCAIGARPINFHLDGVRRMGAKLKLAGGYVEARAHMLSGAKLRLPFPSVGATENLMMAATLANGTTEISNAAREPEITNLADCLRRMGASIWGAGTSKIVVRGVDRLRGMTHAVIPDRIEAATFLTAAAITRGRVKAVGAKASHLQAVLDKLERTGAKIKDASDGIELSAPGRPKPADLRTQVFPGFPTDMQAQWMVLMCMAQGKSRIQETVFENRFLHAQELMRLGAKISFNGNVAIVEGVPALSGGPVMVSDLRAGAALVLAGLAARGKTDVLRIYHLDRGYEKLDEKLRKLGARIKRVKV